MMGKFVRCIKCRNDYPDLVNQTVRDIVCDHCKRYSNFEPLRNDEEKHLHQIKEEAGCLVEA